MGLKNIFDEYKEDLSKEGESKEQEEQEDKKEMSDEELANRMLKHTRKELDDKLAELGKTVDDVTSSGFKNNKLGIARYIISLKDQISEEEAEEVDEGDPKSAELPSLGGEETVEPEEIELSETEQTVVEALEPQEPEEVEEPESEKSKSLASSMLAKLKTFAADEKPVEEVKEKPKKKAKKKKAKSVVPEAAEVPETMIQESEEVKMDLKTERRGTQAEKAKEHITAIKTKSKEYDYSEEQPRKTVTITIFGEKDEGKTAIGMAPLYSAALKKQHSLVIGFDHMAPDIKDELFENNEYIHVVDGTKYWISTDPEHIVETGYTTMDFIIRTIIYYGNKYREEGGIVWVFFDGSKKMWSVCEYAMRYVLGITALGGVEMGQWKQRRWNFRDVFKTGIKNSLRGVLFSAYVNKNEVIRDGNKIQFLDEPVWTDVMLEETQITIRAIRDTTKDPILYTADITSSKKGKIVKTGKKYNVSGTRNLKAFGDIFNR